ncbi:pyridoxal-5'-phosphate-dependent protein [bacterium]|jgi:dTDP-4-amino-4,6-dideoxygalactose transaminase|nr:pyridoxal-5'-phosphate-dependent protein [bacterium]MDP6659890.1 DegT/DnrJ/EryC1/StrS family aminotransferase [Candidatus Paceibacterota bacterium]|tara:strand:- start:44933 stop:46039 length:1107 start_codon:yes stop_codon:yes gene_type:complete
MKKNIPLFKVFMPETVDKSLLETLHSGYIAEGPKVNEFNDIVSSFLGNKYTVPMNSCTTALTVSYRLAGIERGDEVISTPLTCVATNVPLLLMGAKIVWADCEKETGMIDPKKLEEIITNKTKAIVVLHKDGNLAKMDEIMAIAKKHNLKVIEDAAHTFGAKYKGKKVGNIGDYTCFSFQAIKHITTGDGGLLSVKNEEDYKLGRKYKWLGLDKEDNPSGGNIWLNDITISGYKGNMSDISASIGIEQMKHVDEILSKYHENGLYYESLLKDVDGVGLISRNKDDYPTFWTYVILVENRNKLIKALADEGIAASVVHPRNDNYSIFKESKRELTGVNYFSERELSLPCGWWVNKEDVEDIVKIIKDNI